MSYSILKQDIWSLTPCDGVGEVCCESTQAREYLCVASREKINGGEGSTHSVAKETDSCMSLGLLLSLDESHTALDNACLDILENSTYSKAAKSIFLIDVSAPFSCIRPEYIILQVHVLYSTHKSEINPQCIRDHRFHRAIRTLYPAETSCIRKTQGKGNVTTYPLVLLNFCKLSFETTCPQFIIIGGFCSVDWSLDTGHAKTEWYRFSGGKGISILTRLSKTNLNKPRGRLLTGNSSDWLHSLFLSRIIFLPFSIFARAPPPPISPTTLNGGRLLIPKLALNSVANMFSRSRWIASDVRSSYGEFCIRSLGRKIRQPIRRLSSAECVAKNGCRYLLAYSMALDCSNGSGVRRRRYSERWR